MGVERKAHVRLRAATVATMFAMSGAMHHDARGGFLTGNELYQNCTAALNTAQMATCLGFVAGFFDGYFFGYGEASHFNRSPGTPMVPATFCTRPNITIGQIRDVAVKFLRDNPQSRHLDAETLLTLAFGAAFPCPK